MAQGSYFPLQGTEWKPPIQVHTETASWVQVAVAPPQPLLLTGAWRPSAVEGGFSCAPQWLSDGGGVGV